MRWATALLATACLALALPASAQPALWTVRSAHASVILFGSVHLLPHGADWEPPALVQALAHADEIWFELPIDASTAARAQSLMAERGALPKDDNLFAHLTPAQTARLETACARLGVTPAALASMRPWLAEVVLSVTEDARDGASADDGVEQRLSAEVGPQVVRHAFETTEAQIEFLAGTPMADQIASLDETDGEIVDDPGLYRRSVDAWLAGDLAALARAALDPVAEASPILYRRLITERNQRWAEILARRLAGTGEIVVIVGAGHLLGPGGLPALLRARGFEVTGPGYASAGPAAH